MKHSAHALKGKLALGIFRLSLRDLTRKDKDLWLEDLEDTLKNAKDLKAAGFYDVAALYIQLAVEKALKAAIAAFLNTEPPKDHNLMRLYSKVADKLDLNKEQLIFLRELTSAAYETRYMDFSFKRPRENYTKDVADEYMNKALLIIEHIKIAIEAEKK